MADVGTDSESPVVLADRLGKELRALQQREERKSKGQFFTHPRVARYIAGLAAASSKPSLRFLDPGAGTGILTAALCEELTKGDSVRNVHADVFETCEETLPRLRSVLHACECMLRANGISFTFHLFSQDFLDRGSDAVERTLFAQAPIGPYDVVVANPPYGKLPKDDPRKARLGDYVSGQTNLYALFMAISANLLDVGGKLVFIVPRSFASGAYFRGFRRNFFRTVRPDIVHLLESRRDAFSNQDVLQENLIIRASRPPSQSSLVEIRLSEGTADLRDAHKHVVPTERVIDSERAYVLRLPTCARDDRIESIVRHWNDSLATLGYRVSTGPVVAFRAREHHRQEPETSSVPFLWLHNIKTMQVTWPCRKGQKAQYFSTEPDSSSYLVPSRNMVILRRFSAKEQPRRLTAAPLLAGDMRCRALAIENHLNYIVGLKDEMPHDQTIGLAALLNSSLLDRYFRISSGNTQVSATELRRLPLPDAGVLGKIGRAYDNCDLPTLEAIDEAVTASLDISSNLLESLETQATG